MKTIPVLSGVLLLSSAIAQTTQGISFHHHDWLLSCDNTLTCRAVGYQSEYLDGDINPNTIAVMLTREAGADQPVTGDLMMGGDFFESITDIDDNGHLILPDNTVDMRIDGNPIGDEITLRGGEVASLSDEQTQALLATLTQNSRIEFVLADQVWQLSDRGASAVLLKMDEFQGRLDSTDAIVKVGTADSSSVFPAIAKPVIAAAPITEISADTLDETTLAALRSELPTDNDSMCDYHHQSDHEAFKPEALYQVSPERLLAEIPCSLSAYNYGNAYWLMNAQSPFDPVLVTDSGNAVMLEESSIYGYHKGRGLGDCWSSSRWTWDGKSFVHSLESTTGLCRYVQQGGVWELPTLIYDIATD